MAFKIEESFDVKAPVEPVWEFLIDPRRVVVCLPGAELTDVIDERSFGGRVRVKVGPVTAAYKGTVRLEEVTEAEHRVRLTGEGKEAGGTGSAKMAMTGLLTKGLSETTHVRIEADIDVAGKMARFGRGVMEDVSRQLFRDFAAAMKEKLEQSSSDEGPGEAITEEVPTDPNARRPSAGDASTSKHELSSPSDAGLESRDRAKVPSDRANVPSDRANVPSDRANIPSDRANVPSGHSTVPSGHTSVSSGRATPPSERAAVQEQSGASARSSSKDPTRPPDAVAPTTSRPINAVALVFRVIASRIKRLFGG